MDLKNIKLKELIRFLVGGGCAVIVDFVFYQFLVHIGGNMSVSKAISYVLGAVVGFVINKFWTFESDKLSIGEIGRYIILYVCSAVINAGVNKLVMIMFSLTLFAFLCATGVSTIINFLGQKFFVFGQMKKTEVDK